MQNVVLGILAYELTGAAWFVGVLTFAQLGPMLLLSPWGGVLADRFDRRRLLVGIAGTQLVLSLALAVVVVDPTPSKFLITLLVGAIGIGAALYVPILTATIPALVGRRDLQGAVALNSLALNGSRIVGPLVGGLLAATLSTSAVFVVNAGSFLVAIWAVATVRVDLRPVERVRSSPISELRSGFRAAAGDRVILRVLTTIATFSFFSLVFIYAMPVIASERLGLDEFGYTVLFATFAVGAAAGALSAGSFLVQHDRWVVGRWALVVFTVGLTTLALSTSPVVAGVGAFVAGVCYFVVVTTLLTTLQLQTDDAVRGRVMGLWMMAWAGPVPVGALLAGPAIDTVGIVPVLLAGAVVALGLAVSLRHVRSEPPVPA
jgi:MFS family permease